MKQHCQKCGKALVKTSDPSHFDLAPIFDEYTGEKTKVDGYICPKIKGWSGKIYDFFNIALTTRQHTKFTYLK